MCTRILDWSAYQAKSYIQMSFMLFYFRFRSAHIQRIGAILVPRLSRFQTSSQATASQAPFLAHRPHMKPTRKQSFSKTLFKPENLGQFDNTAGLYSAANDPQTGNDPQIGPQMIPNRKWSLMWTANDPRRKRGMAWSLVSWIFSYFLFYFYIHLVSSTKRWIR